MAGGGNRAVVAALLANLGIAVTKFLAFFLTGFSSMLAEAIHSVADSGNQILLLIGGKRVAAGGRRRSIRSGSAASATSTRSSCRSCCSASAAVRALRGRGTSCRRPATRRPSSRAGGGCRSWCCSWRSGWRASRFRTAIARVEQAARLAPWVRFVRSPKAPELPVILLEDFGALIGLMLALFGVGLMLSPATCLRRAGSVASACCWCAIAAFLAVEMKSLLRGGERATPEHQRAILDALAAPEAVQRVIHSKTLHLGPEELLVAAKLARRADHRAAGGGRDHRRGRTRDPRRRADAQRIYLEPDVYHGEPRPRRAPRRPRGALALTLSPRASSRGVPGPAI